MKLTKIKVPRKIKVGGFDYVIRMTPQEHDDLRAFNWSGSHSNILQLIKLDTDNKPQQFSDTFLHEILHAVDVVYNHNSLPEDTITEFAHGLLQVFEQLGIRFVP